MLHLLVHFYLLSLRKAAALWLEEMRQKGAPEFVIRKVMEKAFLLHWCTSWNWRDVAKDDVLGQNSIIEMGDALHWEGQTGLVECGRNI